MRELIFKCGMLIDGIMVKLVYVKVNCVEFCKIFRIFFFLVMVNLG